MMPSPSQEIINAYEKLSPEAQEIIFAGILGIRDVHAPMDNLSEEPQDEVDVVYNYFNREEV